MANVEKGAVVLRFAVVVLFLIFCPSAFSKVFKIFVVDSYHAEYLWSQETNRGFGEALRDQGYLNEKELQSFLKNDEVIGTKVHLRRAWMDTKRKKTKPEIAKTTASLVKAINEFKPDGIMLGDDNAANYIGNQFIDTEIPIVFWGVNGSPAKYNLLDSVEEPGHNVTGVYQAGYYKESLDFLKKINPEIKTFAILADDTATGRTKAKLIKAMAKKQQLSLELVETVITGSFEEWMRRTTELSKTVDAFFVLNHQGLKDDKGDSVDMMDVGQWYLKNIKKPECSDEKQFVEEGLLATVDDSGLNQGKFAAEMILSFLNKKKSPATTPPIAPPPGPRVVNIGRAKSLGLKIDKVQFDETVTRSIALERIK